MSVAVSPVTHTVAPVRSSIAPARSRMPLTRSSVAAADGPLLGVTEMSARSFAGFSRAGETAATSLKPSSSAAVASAARWAPLPGGTSAAMVRRPLKPGPNPSLSRS